jgi:hypothetical protein
MERENPTPGSHFRGPSSHETRMTLDLLRGLQIISDNPKLSDILARRQAQPFVANKAQQSAGIGFHSRASNQRLASRKAFATIPDYCDIHCPSAVEQGTGTLST